MHPVHIVRSDSSVLFHDNFEDGVADCWTEHLGTWIAVNGEYFVSVGMVENGISTVNELNLTDCIIETKLRFADTEVGFRAGIVFRYIDNGEHYSFELSNEYDSVEIIKYTPQNPGYGENISTSLSYPINANVNYTLRIEIHGDTFTGYLNGQHMVTGKDDDYKAGKAGLRARRADVFFDDFIVFSVPKTIIVPDDFSTIQEAINHASDGDKIFARNGTYSGPIVIDKALTLEGENRESTIIDEGSNEPSGSIILVLANNVAISGFTIQHCREGGNAIWLDGYVNMTFSDNIITGCNEGIRILHSSGNVILHNTVQDCYYNTGVGFDWAFNNTVHQNTIINNHYGLSGGYDNHNNIYSENTIINNDIGFGTNMYDDKFFHNNFVNNDVHVIATGVNQFDDGHPSGGNYWSDHNGTDSDGDGIEDIPYIIDENNTDNYPLMSPWQPPDFSINDLAPSKTIIGQGCSATVNLTLLNNGNKIEGTNVTVYVNETAIHTEYVMLKGGNSTTVSSSWNTSGFSMGNYTLEAIIQPILGEVDTSDNALAYEFVRVGIPGDVNANGNVGIDDIFEIAIRFSQEPEHPNWNPNYDIVEDDYIGIDDIFTAAKHFGEEET
jgi:parallel beta-helix repeat protein